MENQEWKNLFSSLPHWNNREKMKDITDDVFESPTSEFLCLIYSVSEVRMMDYRGFLAVFQNKSQPKLLLNPTKINVPRQCPFFDSTGFLMIVQICTPLTDINHTSTAFLITDLKNKRFATIYDPRQTDRPSFTVHETAPFRFDIQPQNLHIKSDRLKYHPLDQLDHIVQMKFKKRVWGNTEIVPIFCKPSNQKD